MNYLRPVPPLAAPGANELSRRVSLMHETARVAEHTPLAPTANGRLATIMETAGYAAAAVRDRDDRHLRQTLLALNVQTQLWLSEIDRDTAA